VRREGRLGAVVGAGGPVDLFVHASWAIICVVIDHTLLALQLSTAAYIIVIALRTAALRTRPSSHQLQLQQQQLQQQQRTSG